MELYEEHYEILKKYKDAKRIYDSKLEKKALLIIQTQPGAIDTTKENVKGGKIADKFERFVSELEKIDPEIQTARNERDLQEYFLKKKELELKNSMDILDKIYYYKYIQKLRVRQIAPRVNYSREQTYRYIKKLEEKLKEFKMTQNDTN
jgi:hypothetical protein